MKMNAEELLEMIRHIWERLAWGSAPAQAGGPGVFPTGVLCRGHAKNLRVEFSLAHAPGRPQTHERPHAQ